MNLFEIRFGSIYVYQGVTVRVVRPAVENDKVLIRTKSSHEHTVPTSDIKLASQDQVKHFLRKPAKSPEDSETARLNEGKELW